MQQQTQLLGGCAPVRFGCQATHVMLEIIQWCCRMGAAKLEKDSSTQLQSKIDGYHTVYMLKRVRKALTGVVSMKGRGS